MIYRYQFRQVPLMSIKWREEPTLGMDQVVRFLLFLVKLEAMEDKLIMKDLTSYATRNDFTNLKSIKSTLGV